MPHYSPHAAPNTVDRVLLSVPYAEKDEARACGARWDPVLQTWWISRHSLAYHPAICRWIPDQRLARRVQQALDFNNGEQWQSPALISAPERPLAPLPECDCTSPPWEHCRHTLQACSTARSSPSSKATSPDLEGALL